MSEEAYPISIEELAATLQDLSQHSSDRKIREVLEESSWSLPFVHADDWNGGTEYFLLNLAVPTALFASVRESKEEVENEILKMAGDIDVAYANHTISRVLLTPKLGTLPPKGKLPASVVSEIWEEGHFKLFLSHLAANKENVHKLKDALKSYGIDCFVAHDDITPSREWQEQIENALRSMDALVALVEPDFIKSQWCDQEVGWALGRGLQVIGVRLNANPHGFIAKIQGVSGTLEYPRGLATSIFEALKTQPTHRTRLNQGLAYALLKSDGFSHSIALSKIIELCNDFSPADKQILWEACRTNNQVYRAHKVIERVYGCIGEPPMSADEVHR